MERWCVPLPGGNAVGFPRAILAGKQPQPANRLRLHDLPLSHAHSHTQREQAISPIKRKLKGFVHFYVNLVLKVRTSRCGREIDNGSPPRLLAARGFTYL
jgi:hypothetical protein